MEFDDPISPIQRVRAERPPRHIFPYRDRFTRFTRLSRLLRGRERRSGSGRSRFQGGASRFDFRV